MSNMNKLWKILIRTYQALFRLKFKCKYSNKFDILSAEEPKDDKKEDNDMIPKLKNNKINK